MRKTRPIFTSLRFSTRCKLYIGNITRGTANDALEYAQNRQGVATPVVAEMHKAFDFLFNNLPPDRDLMVLCQSHGAAVTNLAVRSYHPELQKRIQVTAIAPAAVVSNRHCQGAAHYCSCDFVPLSDPLGLLLDQKHVHYVPSSQSSWTQVDHSFLSPTYQKVIKKIMRYNKTQ